MIFIKVNADNKVFFQHHQPFSNKNGLGKTEEELLDIGYLVESIPEPEQKEGKNSVLYYTEEDGFYYEYVDRPKTESERIEGLEKTVDTLVLENLNA